MVENGARSKSGLAALVSTALLCSVGGLGISYLNSALLGFCPPGKFSYVARATYTKENRQVFLNLERGPFTDNATIEYLDKSKVNSHTPFPLGMERDIRDILDDYSGFVKWGNSGSRGGWGLNFSEMNIGFSMPRVSYSASEDSPSSRIRTITSGWPLRATWTTTSGFYLEDLSPRLALRPIPFGLAADSAVFAGIIGAFPISIYFFRRARENYRIKKGKCAGCGYELGVLRKCPECGHAVK